MEFLDTSQELQEKEKEEMSEFEIVRDLGSGAYGKVYCIKSEKEYRALKVQEFYDVKDGSMIAGSVREHVFFNQFPGHPNVLKCTTFWKVKQNLFFTLPLFSCDLSTLSRLSPFTFQDFLYITRSLCNGLKAMHDAHWMHRDLKMENVLIDSSLGVCISDFNLVRFCGIDIPSETKALQQSPRQVSPRPPKQVAQLSTHATTEVCSLWTRPPEIVLEMLTGKKRSTYGLEFDMFSLGATLLGMLGAGEYVAGAKLPGRGDSLEEKYITACLDLIGVDDETRAWYGPYTNESPTLEKSVERIRHYIFQPCWFPEQKEAASELLVGLLNPHPKKRFSWKQVEEWFAMQEKPPRKISYSVAQVLEIQKTKIRTTKYVTIGFDVVEEANQILRKEVKKEKNELPLDTFWSLCGNCGIPPFIAMEVLRLKRFKAYSIQESQSLLFVFECLHGYINSSLSSQLCYISPEDIWDVLEDLPLFDSGILHLAASLRSYPFKLCCLAAEIALTGKCENPEKLEDTKLMHLSSSAPFFGAYGNQWKSQKDLRSTWLRLLTLGLVTP
jgi:serine/threonine protein kinase